MPRSDVPRGDATPRPACQSCDFPAASTDCTGAYLNQGEPGVFTGYLEASGACSELELELTVKDPRPLSPADDAWLLDLGNAASNDGWGGDDGTLWNDSELEVNSADGGKSWNLQLYANDYYTNNHPGQGKPARIAQLPGFVSPNGETRLWITVRHGSVRVRREDAGGAIERSWGAIDSGDPKAPCSLFCLGQWEDYEQKAGDRLLHVAFQRTIRDRPGSHSTGVSSATLSVR